MFTMFKDSVVFMVCDSIYAVCSWNNLEKSVYSVPAVCSWQSPWSLSFVLVANTLMESWKSVLFMLKCIFLIKSVLCCPYPVLMLCCVQLFVTLDCSLPGSSVHGISQARILEWALPPGDIPDPGIEPTSPVALALQEESSPAEPSWRLL